MALASLTAQMSETVEYVVQRRQKNFDYLRRTHEGKIHWLNIVKLSKANISRMYAPQKLAKRISRWYVLGTSVGNILKELHEGHNIVRAMTQMLDEYDHWCGHPGARGWDMGLFGVERFQQARFCKQESAVKSSLLKGIGNRGGGVVYTWLENPEWGLKNAAGMDLCSVVHSVCDVMFLLYSKFLDESCQPPHIHEAILKLDKRIKQIFLAKVCNDLTTLAKPVMASECRGLLNNMFLLPEMGDGSDGVSRKDSHRKHSERAPGAEDGAGEKNYYQLSSEKDIAVEEKDDEDDDDATMGPQ